VELRCGSWWCLKEREGESGAALRLLVVSQRERGREWSCVAAAGGVPKRERERVELRCGCWWCPKAWPGLGTPSSPLTRTSPGGEKPSDAPAAHLVRNRFLVSTYRPRALTPQRTVTQVDAMETNLHLARAHVDTRVWCVTQSVAAYLQLVEAAVHERNRLEPPGTREAVRSVLAPLHPYATYCPPPVNAQPTLGCCPVDGPPHGSRRVRATGRDTESAIALNDALVKHFPEEQVRPTRAASLSHPPLHLCVTLALHSWLMTLGTTAKVSRGEV
jgi:hypothetical protein